MLELRTFLQTNTDKNAADENTVAARDNCPPASVHNSTTLK